MVIQAPMEEVNSDGKANLDILSTVKYGKELLNEQLIPQRYHVPAKTSMEEGKGIEQKKQIAILTFCCNCYCKIYSTIKMNMSQVSKS